VTGSRPRILFLATNPREGASTRYRVLQYFSLLEQNSFECLFQPFFSSQAIGVLYQPGHMLRKFLYFLEGCVRRYLALLALKNRVDLIFIHRELFPLGIPFFLKKVRRLRIPTIYDYDDAMFLPQRQDRGLLSFLERPATVDELIRRSTCVIAGNTFLSDYAIRLNSRTVTIPTLVDTEAFSVKDYRGTSDGCVIGWIGSHSTAKYLRVLSPVLERLAHTHRFSLKVIGAGNPVRIPGVEVISLPWSLQREPEEFRTCDIGVYPLWDDEWAKGKCGFSQSEE